MADEFETETIKIDFGQGVPMQQVDKLFAYYVNETGAVTRLEEQVTDDDQVITATVEIHGEELEDIDIIAHEITDEGKYDYQIL
ncbi:hypothetical protein PQ472_12160 [Lacticaseibacillus pabuli]|uniref:Uncharacterized protein n=1 Tax=Lacticaseibacillus pabuli TaxID=3025672 RepID=A0ABY7WUB0_9LACO|nr:hypothetical protein [Lacticaseibacillus sp. KACC 23028]WDF82629.1 hypothetical protein PQ472_12160 [Lacticaseibacillus sp. KACC 23028]